MNPNNWSTVFSFCTSATLFSVSYGWLVKKGKLPLNSVMAFNDAQFKFIKIWAKLAGLIGIVVPVVIWIVFWLLFMSCSPSVSERMHRFYPYAL